MIAKCKCQGGRARQQASGGRERNPRQPRRRTQIEHRGRKKKGASPKSSRVSKRLDQSVHGCQTRKGVLVLWFFRGKEAVGSYRATVPKEKTQRDNQPPFRALLCSKGVPKHDESKAGGGGENADHTRRSSYLGRELGTCVFLGPEAGEGKQGTKLGSSPKT